MTKRQQQIVLLLSQGLINKQVAEKIGVSVRSIEGSIARIKDKYQADTLFRTGVDIAGGTQGGLLAYENRRTDSPIS